MMSSSSHRQFHQQLRSIKVVVSVKYEFQSARTRDRGAETDQAGRKRCEHQKLKPNGADLLQLAGENGRWAPRSTSAPCEPSFTARRHRATPTTSPTTPCEGAGMQFGNFHNIRILCSPPTAPMELSASGVVGAQSRYDIPTEASTPIDIQVRAILYRRK